MTANLVVVTTDQLAQLITETVKTALKEQSPIPSRSHAVHEYLSMAEAAEYLQMPQSTLYQYCANRRLPYTKRGKRNFFLRADLDAFMASDRRESVTEMEEQAMNKLRKGGAR
jgi:excisionase family DNA binding protein